MFFCFFVIFLYYFHKTCWVWVFAIFLDIKNDVYYNSNILNGYILWFEVIFIANICETNMQILLLVTMIILRYFFSAISFFALMRKRKMSHKYVAFIPFFNTTFALGNISDSINKNYFKKTFNKFFLLILWLASTISGTILIFLIKHHVPNFYEKFLESIFKQTSNLNISNYNFSSLSSSTHIDILICSLAFIISLIINFVLSFYCFYTIYREYNKNYSNIYILLAILGNCFLNLKFIPPLLVFLIHKNIPVFEFLNTISTNKEHTNT